MSERRKMVQITDSRIHLNLFFPAFGMGFHFSPLKFTVLHFTPLVCRPIIFGPWISKIGKRVCGF